MNVMSILREKVVFANTNENTSFILSECESYVRLANSVKFCICLNNYINPGQNKN